MKKIDPHHHLWDLKLNKNPWLTDKNSKNDVLGNFDAIRKTYDWESYIADIKALNIVKTVFVQAGWDSNDPCGETQWVSELPDSKKYLQAVVGFCDLSNPNAQSILAEQAEHKKLRGIRQIIARSDDPNISQCGINYLEDPTWRKQYALLEKYDLSFDAQIFPHQVDSFIKLAKKHPNIPVVVEHCGMPLFAATDDFSYWKGQLEKLAQLPNTSLKISGIGMLTKKCSLDIFSPIVETCIHAFTPERCMFASNFPVDGLYYTMTELYHTFETLVKNYSLAEQQALFYDTANQVYRL